MCGAPTEVIECAEGSDEQTMFTAMRPQMEEKHGKAFEMFDIVHYTTQVVAGTNYQVKIQIGAEEWAHAKIYKKLPHEGEEKELTAWMAGQTADSAIDFNADVEMQVEAEAEPEEPPMVGISDKVKSGDVKTL